MPVRETVWSVKRYSNLMGALQILILLMAATASSLSTIMAQSDTNVFLNLEEISLENGMKLQQLAVMDNIQSGYSISPDDTKIAATYPDGVRIYDLSELNTPILFFPIKDAFEVYAPVFSPDGKRLSVTFIPQNEMKSITQVWNIEAEKVERTFTTEYFSLNTDGAHFSPNGRYLMGNGRAYYPDRSADEQPNEAYGALYVWDLEAGRILCDPMDCSPRYGISDFTFTPDSQDVFWGIPDTNLDGNFEVNWNLLHLDENTPSNVSRYLMDLLSTRTGPFAVNVRELVFSPKGNILASISPLYPPNQKAQFWDVQSGEPINTLFDDNFDFFEFFDDQVVLVSDLSQNSVSLVNIYTNESAVLFRNMPKNNWSVRVGNTKKLFTTRENNELKFWGVPKS